MATVILDHGGFALEIQNDTLVLRQEGERLSSVPLKMVERLILQGNVRLDVDTLRRLGEAGASVLCLSARHSRRLALVLGPRHNDAAIRLGQTARVTDRPFCNAFARRQVRAKLRAQARVLADGEAARPDARKPLTDARQALAAALAGLPAQADTDTLRGIEGAAARAYFAGLAALLPPALGFAGRNRRPPRDPANACLSLAYTLLHFEAVHAAHTAGLDPMLGFYHRPAFGRESLASDLIEPLRPRADAFVLGLFARRVLRTDHFGRDGAACLLTRAGREHFYRAWEEAVAPLRRALRRECRLLAAAFRRAGEPWLADAAEEDTP